RMCIYDLEEKRKVANLPVLPHKTLLVGISVPESGTRRSTDAPLQSPPPPEGVIYRGSLSLLACSYPLLQHEDLASPPYPCQHSTLFLVLRQYVLVIRVLLAEYRRTWFGQVFMGFLIPIGLAFFLKAIGNVSTMERAVFLLGGNLATSI